MLYDHEKGIRGMLGIRERPEIKLSQECISKMEKAESYLSRGTSRSSFKWELLAILLTGVENPIAVEKEQAVAPTKADPGKLRPL